MSARVEISQRPRHRLRERNARERPNGRSPRERRLAGTARRKKEERHLKNPPDVVKLFFLFSLFKREWELSWLTKCGYACQLGTEGADDSGGPSVRPRERENVHVCQDSRILPSSLP